MNSLLNKNRPPAFCPGCSNDKILHALDKSFQNLGLRGDQIVIVSDIGCCGLFDTFFHTHALHGLHGRALTYAAGLKLARPDLKVVVIMGDGGLGIGGAHLTSACRRNLDLTLLIFNNFNYGMTGGQCSATTPSEAQVGSGFLNQLERPLDACQYISAAGAPYVCRCSSYAKNLEKEIENALRFEGFSVMDIWGICTGRYLKFNKLSPKMIADNIAELPFFNGPVEGNLRKEYGHHYRELAANQKISYDPLEIQATCETHAKRRQEVIILGVAGQRIITAGEILCYAGLSAGLKVTQKNEYRGTVRRGHSISEVILSPEKIDFTGIENPSVIIALSQEGVAHRTQLFDRIGRDTLVIRVNGVKVPANNARVHKVDLKRHGVKSKDWALACLLILAKLDKVITLDMLKSAIGKMFTGHNLTLALDVVDRIESSVSNFY